MNKELSREFVLFLESNATRLFELIESGETPHVADGFLSKPVRAIQGIGNKIKLWRTIPFNQKLMKKVDGLVWKTFANELGLWLCVFYRGPDGKLFWYTDLFPTKFWNHTANGIANHHKQWHNEKVPAFIWDSIQESSRRFQHTNSDFMTPRPNSNVLAVWYTDFDFGHEFNSKPIQAGRDEFIESQPWLYGTDWSLGIGGSMRPFLIIRNHNQYFLKSIPIDLRRSMVSWGKTNGVYAELLSTEQRLLKQSVAA